MPAYVETSAAAAVNERKHFLALFHYRRMARPTEYTNCSGIYVWLSVVSCASGLCTKHNLA